MNHKEQIRFIAESLNIRLLREDIPDLDDRIEILRHRIGEMYARSTNRSSNGSSR